jgi:hypothetical protein
VRPTRLLTGLASVALLVVGLLALLPDCAYACLCPVTPSTQQGALAESTAIFSGQVLDIEKGWKIWGGVPSTTVSFRVSEVWRGPKRETVEVTTPSGGPNPACGYTFSVGRKYLVYAYGKEEPFKVDSCGQTRLLSKASGDLEALGNVETLGGNRVLSDTSGGFPPLGVMGMVGGAVAAVSLVVLMRLVRTG